MNLTKQQKRTVMILGLGTVVIIAVTIAVVVVQIITVRRLAQQARDDAYVEIVKALDNGSYEAALNLIDEHEQHLSEREVRDFRTRAVVGRDNALARAARDEIYIELQAFIEQDNDISALLSAKEFLKQASTPDADPRATEVEQIRDRIERKLARDDAYSQVASILDANESAALKAAEAFLNNLASGDVDDRTAEVERIKAALDSKAQARRDLFSALVSAFEQGDYRATADNARLTISHNPNEIDPAVIDMYAEALKLWAAQAPDDDPQLKAHLESYARWIEQGPQVTQTWIVSELTSGQDQMKQGNYDEALGAYRTVQAIHPAFTSSAQKLNNICWWGGLWGYDHEELLGICEQGVAGALSSVQVANHRDSRGVVRALRGDFAGAIADFEFFIEIFSADPARDQSLVAERRVWIDALNQNVNPFTDDVLTRLREQ